jgi:nucleotide-binding universal stress UspA family protein
MSKGVDTLKERGAPRVGRGEHGMIRPIFDRVVLATDLSPAWDQIAGCGGELRKLGCFSVILTYVITPNFFGGPGESLPPPAASRLAAQRRVLEEKGLEVIIETPIGLPGRSLNGVAQRYGTSLIIIGSHGQSRWREGVLGTFSGAVLHNVQFPLLLLPVQVAEDQEPSCLWHCTELFSHLLFPTDFSQTAAAAMCYLELLSPRGVSRVTLLHALVPLPGKSGDPQGTTEAAAVARNFLDLLQGRLEAAGVPEVQTRIMMGHPVSAILELLKTTAISLIVLGTQGKGAIAEISLGGVAHNISRFAPCPILLIPPTDRDDRE